MSEDLVSEPFDAVSKRVQEAYDLTASELKEKVARARSEALKQIGS
jgi:hypothetical protein